MQKAPHQVRLEVTNTAADYAAAWMMVFFFLLLAGAIGLVAWLA